MTRKRPQSASREWSGPRPTPEAVQTPPYGFRVPQQNASVLIPGHLGNVGSNGSCLFYAMGTRMTRLLTLISISAAMLLSMVITVSAADSIQSSPQKTYKNCIRVFDLCKSRCENNPIQFGDRDCTLLLLPKI